jgi:hypothetical protein
MSTLSLSTQQFSTVAPPPPSPSTAAEYLIALINNPKVAKIYPNLMEDQFVSNLTRYILANTGQLYFPVVDIESVSAGLSIEDNNVVLSHRWGVQLSATSHASLIDTPVNIRSVLDKILITNGGALASTVACGVYDQNLNFLAPVGKKGTVLTSGEYSVASDFTLNDAEGFYYIAASVDHIVHYYKTTDLSFVGSLGNGTPGADGTEITNPSALGIGENFVYVLCSAGTPAGSSGPGFIARYNLANTFVDIPLYHGKNGGTGLVVQGEITAPKDMVIRPSGGRDYVYVLNGSDEIGRFVTDSPSNDLVLDTVYNIPTDVLGTNLGLTKIDVDSEFLYVTAQNLGEVIKIRLDDKTLAGRFGMLRAETTAEADQTLGYFNGLSGIAVIGDTIHTTETLNNRVQTFGTSLLADGTFDIEFRAVRVPLERKLTDITYSRAGGLFANLKIVDKGSPNAGQEYDIDTAIKRDTRHFAAKLKIQPHVFSRAKSVYEIYPVYILSEG